MHKVAVLILLVALAALWSGCSEKTSPEPSLVHPDNWTQATSKDGHGQKVLTSGLNSCKSCHGTDLKGGESGVSCFKCHTLYPHAEGWLASGNSQFHGAYLARKSYLIADCTPCHGEDLQGGEGKMACVECHPLYPHATNWNKAGDAAFHGAFIKGVNWDLTACKTCHGDDFQGQGTKAACNVCHASYPHTSSWVNPADGKYHGAYLAQRSFNPDECKSCHGDDLRGGEGKASCYACHETYPHNVTFKGEPNATDFHGAYLRDKGYDLSSCTACHGSDYKGGTSGASCLKCHGSYPHTTTWLNPSAEDSHIGYLREHQHDLQECQACHGADYKGGSSGGDCFVCHSGAKGPEACNLCHGSDLNNAPPKDSKGGTEVTDKGVGRHQFHIVSKKYNCVLCHTVPVNYSDPGHVLSDDTADQAEVNALWQYNHSTATCVTGCHANDPSKNYIWNH